MDPFYMAALLVSIVLASIYWYIKSSTRLAGKTPPLPPGPRGLPILGYLPFLRSDILQQFTDLARQYGPIYKLRLGSKLTVVIASPSLIKQVVRDQDPIFADRDATVAALVLSRGANDIAFSPQNSNWRLMRKILAREMQSNSSLEASYELRKDEVRNAIRHVYSKIGEPIDVGELAFVSDLNLVMNLLWGGKIEGEEGKRLGAEFRTVISKVNDLIGTPNVSDYFPALSRFDLQGIKKKMQTLMESVDKILDDVIAEHERPAGVKNEGKKDFVQILLELKKNEDVEMSNITMRQLKAMLQNLIFGGTDTTATTIELAFAELMNNPEVMYKVQKELSDVVGTNTLVEEFHLPKLHYLQAVLKETMRLHPPVPFLVPRSPNQSSTIGGYTVPKNTRVFINVWAIQRDPSIWDNPMEFRPDRFFINPEKWDFSGNNFHYLPFGSGRRVCPGLPLAERMVTYLLASFLHSFDWKLREGEKYDMSERFGIVLRKNIPLVAIPSPRLSDKNLYV
ncbi:UNVERIFIED_CONTAM: Labd-13Z-ene-9,15,16-triol synthase, chloroplastic [Sesamum calycinum]|uniref:Labd-13Z-ene-9,15,16-triol synthase, chloroplastic n=1 Tax=Sesamum calycinum TaxID=2727403 RepID=A0AAW2LYX7_9LAMI